eukprot:gene10708-14379_t
MNHILITLIVAAAVLSTASGFSIFNQPPRSTSTKLYERFDFNFKNPKIESDKLIFTEKQLREYTATYSNDYRMNPFEFLTSLLPKSDSSKPVSTPKPPSALSSTESALKPSVSLSVLEEKTALYVTGKSDAKAYYTVLTAAFGNKLSAVLPEILENLPQAKAKALKDVAK